MRSVCRAVKFRLFGFKLAYKWYQRLKHPNFSGEIPDFVAANKALRDQEEADRAAEETRRIDLPMHSDLPKNWDTLTALTLVLREGIGRDVPILDAGGLVYGSFLHSLHLYGYTDMNAVNLEFKRAFNLGHIRYTPGDVTGLSFPDEHFGMVFCQSVIEHGVPLKAYFREMARVVRPGGLMVLSTDYWEPKLATEAMRAYGAAVQIFCREDIEAATELAQEAGWSLTSQPDYECKDRVVNWRRFNLQFTFYTVVRRA